MKKVLPIIIFISLAFLYMGPLSTLSIIGFNFYVYLPYLGSIFVFIVSLKIIYNNFKNNKNYYEIIPFILYLICAVGIFFVYYPIGLN